MIRTLVVLFALAVGACTESDHKVQDLAACQLEVIKLYPNWPMDDDGSVTGVARGHFTEVCMTAKGYELQCPADLGGFTVWVTQTNDRCYRKAKAN
jgi:hypothetical protein